MKKWVLIVITAVNLAGFVSAETQTLTVEDAVGMAIAQNLNLKRSGITLRGQERAKKTAWNAFLPSISVSAGLSGNHGIFTFRDEEPAELSDPGKLGFNAGLNLSLPLNLAAGFGIKKLILDYEAGLLDYEAAVKGLERNVRKQFYKIVANEENIRIQKANLNLAEKRYNQAQNDFDNGLSSKLDVMLAKVTLAGLQPEYNAAVAGFNALLLVFKTDIGMNRDDDIKLVGDLSTEPYNVDATDLIQKYASGRLDIRSLDKQIAALKLSKTTVALNVNSPTLNLGYNYGLSGSNAEENFLKAPIDPWSNWVDSGTISLGMQWKLDGIIPGSSTNVQLKKIQDGIDNLSLARELAWQGAGTEITNLVNNLETSQLIIEANTTRVELAKETFDIIEESYRLGTKTLLDVESTQNDYLIAQQQLLLAKYNYIAGLLDLEYALNVSMEDLRNK